MARPLRSLSVSLLLGVAVLASAPAARGASKAKIAAIGDAAPGGGIFAGPGFSAWPTAAGSGWIAFRGETTGGGTSETMVAAHLTVPVTTMQVASLGQAAPSAGVFTKCAGKIRQFVGQPVVNANGDVAFMALIEPPADTSGSSADVGPTPAGIFLFRGGLLSPVACSGQPTAGGVLDLTAIVDPLADDTGIADRAPSLDNGGNVAFLTGYVNDQGLPRGAAIVVAALGGGYREIARIDGAFDGGKFFSLGPPALSNAGLLAFHGLVTTSDPAESDGLIDGIFAADGAGLHVLVKDGISPMPANQPIAEFEDPIAVNDRGDVAFLAGPIFDPENTSVDDEGGPAVLVWSGGVVTLVAYPGQLIGGPGGDRVTGVVLGPAGASAVATPSLAPDGSVVFFASLNSGSSEAIFRWNGAVESPALVYTGGSGADASPTGGVYAGAASAAAADGVGGIVFLARITGGASSEAVVYRAADGTATPIVLGQAAPKSTDGFFAGKPFAEVHLNDRGDIVFRAFVARGPTSLGIFREQPEDATLVPVARVSDPAPLAGAPPFVDLVGEPSLNQQGDVAFAAQVGTRGRGLFVADATGALRKVVVRGDDAPGIPGTQFVGLGTPRINDAGAVAFRGTTAYRDPSTQTSIKQEGIFLADASGTRALVYLDDPSPAGLPYFTFRDPFVTDAGAVLFRAPLGTDHAEANGIFVTDGTTTTALATQLQALGAGVVLSGFNGDPDVTANGRVAFLATRLGPTAPDGPPIRDLGPAIMAGDATTFALVVARNMPGPAGGTYKSLGTPAINGNGHIAFFGSFNPLTGGTSGLFLEGDGGLVPSVLRGELTPIGGRFGSIGSHVEVNAADEVVFSAKVSGGKARSAIFVASPTTLSPSLLAVRDSAGRGRDRVQLRARLGLGRVSDGVHPAKEAVVVSLADKDGTLWSATVPAKRLKGTRRVFSLHPRPSSDLGHALRAIRIVVGRDGSARVSAVSPSRIDLTHGGVRPLDPPFTITVEIGDDAGRASMPCALGPRGGRC